MIDKIKQSYVLLFGIFGFILATLLMTIGLFKTIFIIIISALSAFGGYWIEKYNIDFSKLKSIINRK